MGFPRSAVVCLPDRGTTATKRASKQAGGRAGGLSSKQHSSKLGPEAKGSCFAHLAQRVAECFWARQRQREWVAE